MCSSEQRSSYSVSSMPVGMDCHNRKWNVLHVRNLSVDETDIPYDAACADLPKSTVF